MRLSQRQIRASLVIGLIFLSPGFATGSTLPTLIAAGPNQCSSCIWFSSTPTFAQNESYISFHTILSSDLNQVLPVFVYVIVRDGSSGQMITTSTASGILPASYPATSNLAVILVVPNLLPGVYVATFSADSADGTISSGAWTIQFTVNAKTYPLGIQTLTIVSATSPPVGVCQSWCTDISYQNNANASISIVVSLVFHNSIGQTVYMERVAEWIAKGQTVSAHLSVSGLTTGIYSAEIFAISSSGVALSSESVVAVAL